MKKIIRATIVFWAAFAVNAQAAEWSVGVFAGQSTISDLNQTCNDAVAYDIDPDLLPLVLLPPAIICDSDDSEVAGGVYGSYQFNQNWSIEAGYADLGEFSSELDQQTLAGITSVFYDASTVYAAGVFTLPLSDRFSVSGKLGLHNTTIDTNINIPDLVGTDRFDLDPEVYAGASLNLEISDQFSAHLRYDNFDVEVVGVGLQYNFN